MHTNVLKTWSAPDGSVAGFGIFQVHVKVLRELRGNQAYAACLGDSLELKPVQTHIHPTHSSSHQGKEKYNTILYTLSYSITLPSITWKQCIIFMYIKLFQYFHIEVCLSHNLEEYNFHSTHSLQAYSKNKLLCTSILHIGR